MLSRTPLIAVLVAFAVPAAVGPEARSAPGRGTGEQDGAAGVAALRICGNDPFPRHVGLYRYVILNSWDYRDIPAIRARNPGTKVLVYKDMASSRDDAVHNGVDSQFLQSGVGYAYASRRHPEWFLEDTRGSRVSWASWPHAWQMDVGSDAYQQAWLANVARELKARHWDGVFVDGITARPQASWALNGRIFTKYPSDADYQRAATSFLHRVGPALRRRGALVVANVNDADHPLWQRWVGYLSGTAREWWTKSQAGRGAGLLGGDEWSAQMKLLRASQARRKIFIAVTYGPPDDVRSIRYARASFLLAANGRRSAMTYSSGCGSQSWLPGPTEKLGAPRGGAFSPAAGVWRRNFRRGTVLVNTSGSTVQVSLGGRYRTPDGSVVYTVRLEPLAGILLRR